MDFLKLNSFIFFLTIFSGFVHCIELNCNVNDRGTGPHLVCENLSITKDKKNEKFDLNKDVKNKIKHTNISELVITKSSMAFLPEVFHKSVDKLNTIDMSDMKFTSMDESFFKGYEMIKTLRLSFIDLNEIEQDALTHLTGLENIFFTKCDITSFSKLYFKNNKNLTNINLAENPINSLNPATFEDLPETATVVFDGNCLSGTHNMTTLKDAIMNQCSTGNTQHFFKLVEGFSIEVGALESKVKEMSENQKKQDSTRMDQVISDQKVMMYALILTNVVAVVGFIGICIFIKKQSYKLMTTGSSKCDDFKMEATDKLI